MPSPTTLAQEPAEVQPLPKGYCALVIGASGGIGAAFVQALSLDPDCGLVLGLHRQSTPAIDFDYEASVAEAAQAVAKQGPFHLIIHAAGILHSASFTPEKKLGDLNYAQLEATFRANTFGPALVLRHLSPLLSTERSSMVFLSAKVGSIGDNRLGGWYSYRASKAALNMLVKTASIELRRTKPQTCVLAMHPGTVQSRLSQPFGSAAARPAEDAVRDMLNVIRTRGPEHSGQFAAYNGEGLPW